MKTNKSMYFDGSLIDSIRINRSAIEDRAKTLGTRRSFKVEAQAAAYLRAIQCMDLTTLSGDDTPASVQRLCVKALQPVEKKTLEKLGLNDWSPTVGAVCVYHELIRPAVAALKGRLPVAAVSTGFPAGQTPLQLKLAEIKNSLYDGATEIDVVISRNLVLTGKWVSLYQEIKLFREMCGDKAKMKTILGVGNLGTLENVAKASAVAIMAGSDFIKTSTGFEPVNATLEAGLVMVRQIRLFQDLNKGLKIGFKPAGGIKTAKDAMLWLILMLEELDEEWTKPELFRIGAGSQQISFLNDLEQQLHHLAFGRYSDDYRHPMG